MWFLQIVISLFVAVILDNLELDEDIKKLKQVKYLYNEVLFCNLINKTIIEFIILSP